jgi:hypothetical protein
VDIERRIDSDMAVRRLVDSWLSRSVAGLPSGRDDDSPPLRSTGPDAPRRGAGPGDEAEPGAGPDDAPGLGTGLEVPPAPAKNVIVAARHIATSGRWTGPWPDPAPEFRSVAEAMVLDEHPSAGEWTLAERRDALDWIARVIDRFGEDGVQRLVAELNERP